MAKQFVEIEIKTAEREGLPVLTPCCLDWLPRDSREKILVHSPLARIIHSYTTFFLVVQKIMASS